MLPAPLSKLFAMSVRPGDLIRRILRELGLTSAGARSRSKTGCFASLQERQLVAFNHKASESAGRVSPGIDVDAIGPELGLQNRRVSMDDDLSMVIFALQ